MPGHAEHLGDRLEHHGARTPSTTGPSRAGRARPSPSRGRRPASKSWYMTLPMRESPQHSTVSAGGVGHVGLEPVEGPLGHRRAADVGDRPLVPGARPREVARERRSRPGSRAGRGSRRRSAASGIACRPAIALTVLSWSRALLRPSAQASASQLSPQLYGGTSGGTIAVDPVHEEERRAEHRRRSARRARRSAPARRSARRRSASRRTGPGARSP